LADGLMTLPEVEKYVSVVVPNIERLYVDVLRLIAPYDFISYNKYLELDEDHNIPTKAFYHQRRKHMAEVFQAFNDMEIHDKYDIMIISMPPRVGKTTTGIRFLSWIAGKYPEDTQLATSYSDNITSSFYAGVMEIVQTQRFREVFPQSGLVNQNAKREEIWLKVIKRYPTLTFVPIGGSMTGRCEASRYLYCDDLVSGYEEAISIARMDKLWQLYTINCKQRKLDHAKEIHLATVWSVHDVISRLIEQNKDNPRCKIINVPCFNEEGESNFDFNGGFSTGYYRQLEKDMDSFSFNALYKGEAVEREGLLYTEEELNYYFELPEGRPDTIIAICDSKNLGKDYVCSPIGYVYGDTIFIEDVVYNNGLPDVTRPKVANAWIRHKVVRADVELNNGGNYYAEDLNEMIRDQGAKTTIKMFFSGNNKTTKIITYSDFVKKNFVFKAEGTYDKKSEYASFMHDLLTWTQLGNNKHDDSVDAIAMLGQMFQELNGNMVKIINRRDIGL
jgi:predicted phage terminase large subunit-like protein